MAEHLASVESAAQRRPASSRTTPSRSESSSADTLPAALSSFLGRDKEISEISGALEASRLVTLAGAPGIGKTRLALEVAGGAAAGGPAGGQRQGTALVELAPMADPALVPRAIAAALRVQEVPGSTLTQALVAALHQRRLLLVLDNCEHLLGACAQVAGALLSGCPHLRILATSREPLSIAGERVWQVPALSVPGPGEDPLPDGLIGYESVQLFVERARAVQPQWELTEEVCASVAEVARRLDGIPLALELAATRIETLTAAEIARRLDDRFALLTRGSRGGLPRHQTLQGAIDWSHDLLSSPERALLRRLSVFVGGFCLEAAETVCAGGEIECSEVFDLLAGLVSKSLVVANTANSRGRYRMLETVRAYAADRLEETEEAPALGAAHARFYLALAEAAEPNLTGPAQDEWLERLEGERENLRFALLWSLGHGRREWALGLGGALILFWRVRCHFGEGRELLEAAIGADAGEADGLTAKVRWGAGFLTMMAGDPNGALPLLEDSLDSFRALGDRAGTARAQLILANCKQCCENPSAVSLLEKRATILALLEESTVLAREAGDTWCLAHACGIAGHEYAATYDLPAARPKFEECIEVARQAEDTQALRFGLLGLGQVAVAQGDYGVGESLLYEAKAIARELGDDYGVSRALTYLGQLALGRGDYPRAGELLDEGVAVLAEVGPVGADLDARLFRARVIHAMGDLRGARDRFEDLLVRFGGRIPILGFAWIGELAVAQGNLNEGRLKLEQARDLARAVGDMGSLAQALHGLGRLVRQGGDLKRAATIHNEALRLRHQIGELPGVATSLEAAAGLAAAGGRHPHAARLLGMAQAMRDTGGYARLPWESILYEADLALVREGLTPEELDAAFAQGQELSVEQAVTQASKGRRRRGPPASGWPSLTETERQVAELVAEGLTNPEIAERLPMSLGTVKAHMSNIFSKLGVEKRTELALEVSRRDREPG